MQTARVTFQTWNAFLMEIVRSVKSYQDYTRDVIYIPRHQYVMPIPKWVGYKIPLKRPLPNVLLVKKRVSWKSIFCAVPIIMIYNRFINNLNKYLFKMGTLEMGSLSENVGMMTRMEYLRENVCPLGNATVAKLSIAIMKDVIYIPILQFVMLIQQQ